MRDRIANDAANIVTAHGMLDQLCAVVWLEEGRLKVLAPQGCDESLALMMYRAADTFAERAAPSLNTTHNKGTP
jgi:hypothetical protein